MKIKKSRAVFLVVLWLGCLFGLTGCDSCLSYDAEVYGLLEVLEYVDPICGEPYRLLGRELVEEKPDNMEYYFEATTRELSFTANSYLRDTDFYGLYYYTRVISCDYADAVRELYQDELEQVLQENDHYLNGRFYLLSFLDIYSVVDTILAADQVYRQELAYNSEEFLADNPLDFFGLYWYPSEEEALAGENSVRIDWVYITGQNDRGELYDELANSYTQLCVNGKIENMDDVPE